MNNKIKLASQIVEGFYNLTLNKIGLSNEEIEHMSKLRMDVCKKCPLLSNNEICNDCGCYMPSKTRVREASCPKKHW